MSTTNVMRLVFAVALVITWLSPAFMTSDRGNRALAQVVQLPAYRTFSYSGSAWVPDQGSASLAGGYTSGYSVTGRGFGPYAARARGGRAVGSSITTSATIIDLAALDEALLNIPAAQRDPNAAPVVSAVSPAASGKRRYLTTTEPYLLDTGITPHDANQYRRVLAGHSSRIKSSPTQSQTESDVRFYLEQGKLAENANRINSARVYYRMAMEAMTPDMLERYRRILDERKKAEEERKKANRPDRIQF